MGIELAKDLVIYLLGREVITNYYIIHYNGKTYSTNQTGIEYNPNEYYITMEIEKKN
jgi:hypothetical protein